MIATIQAPITQSPGAEAVGEWTAEVQELETVLHQTRTHYWQLALASKGMYHAKQLCTVEEALLTAQLAFEKAIEQQTAVHQAEERAQAQRQHAEADAIARHVADYRELIKECTPEVAYAKQQLN